jgi:hypothetical protein
LEGAGGFDTAHAGLGCEGVVTGNQKRVLFIALGIVVIGSSINMWRRETQRSMTSETISGTLLDVHTVSQVRNQTQHFLIESDNGHLSRDLYTEEPLMFMKAQDGQRVEATITSESGYVSRLRIVAGPHTGYSYDGPDQRNTSGAIALFVLGSVLIAGPIFGYVTDRQAAG